MPVLLDMVTPYSDVLREMKSAKGIENEVARQNIQFANIPALASMKLQEKLNNLFNQIAKERMRAQQRMFRARVPSTGQLLLSSLITGAGSGLSGYLLGRNQFNTMTNLSLENALGQPQIPLNTIFYPFGG